MQTEAMNAMKILKQMWHIRQRIQEIDTRIARLRDEAEKATITYSAANASSGVSGQSRVEKNMITAIDLERQMIRTEQSLYLRRHTIQAAIDSMDQESEKRILELRYIDRMSWPKIRNKMHVSRSNSFRLHESALISFSKNLS